MLLKILRKVLLMTTVFILMMISILWGIYENSKQMEKRYQYMSEEYYE